MEEAEVKVLLNECSNWGRWGSNDDLGTLNYITQTKRIEAATLVRTGRCIGIGLVGGDIRTDANPQPPIHRMLYMRKDYPAYIDSVDVAPHGWSTTHIDALGHFSFNGKMYNGRTSEDVVTSTGLTALSIDAQRNGIFTRGVMLDVAKALGEQYLPAGYGITIADLEAAEHLAGVSVTSGDAIVVRAGKERLENSPKSASNAQASGLLPECIPWLHEREVAVYSGDCQEMRPSGYASIPEPLHQIGLVGMGLCMLDMPDVEALASAVAIEGRSEFLITCAAVPLPRATGAAVNPLCIF